MYDNVAQKEKLEEKLKNRNFSLKIYGPSLSDEGSIWRIILKSKVM